MQQPLFNSDQPNESEQDREIRKLLFNSFPMEEIEKRYPGNFVFNCEIERHIGTDQLTVQNITLCRIFRSCSKGVSKRLSAILTKQLSKNLIKTVNLSIKPNKNVLTFGSSLDWNIDVN